MDIRRKQTKKKLISKTNIIYFIVFVLLTFIDQITKYAAVHFLREGDIHLIPDVLQLHYLENTGAAWGILKDQTWLLSIITVIVLVVFVVLFIKIPGDANFRLLRIALVLLTAGALGNFIDRIVNQYVIDFIYVSLINFPVFNVADCFICISAVMILYGIVFKYKEEDFEKWKQNK